MKLLFGMFLLLSGIVVVSISCGKNDDDGSLNFSGPARETIPLLNSALTSSVWDFVERSAWADTWGNGNLFYEMWYTFADSSGPAPTSQGTWGSENLFNNIALTDGYTRGLSCDTSLGRAITAPLTLGTETYQCGKETNYSRTAKIAYTKDGGITKALIASHTSNEQLVMMGSYNSGTGDLTLKVVTYVAYSNSNKFIMRMDAIGNTTTHAFTLQYSKRNPQTGFYNMDIAGKGIAKGAGNYFLLRMREKNSESAWGSDKFYCYPADVTPATLQTLSEGTDLKADASTFTNCAGYRADVENTTTVPYLLDTDLPAEAMNMAIF